MTPERRRQVEAKAKRFNRAQQKLIENVSMDEVFAVLDEQPAKLVLDYARRMRQFAEEIERRVRARKRARTR